LVDEVLRDMSREFDGLYARVGRPSIPPERLLRAQFLARVCVCQCGVQSDSIAEATAA
jgi:hypothetical protein